MVLNGRTVALTLHCDWQDKWAKTIAALGGLFMVLEQQMHSVCQTSPGGQIVEQAMSSQ